MKNVVGSLWARYSRMLETRPFLTRIITSGVVLSLGDIGAQHLASDHKYDPKRTAKMAVIGTFLVGPHVYTWFKFLEYILPGKAVKTVIAKVTIDQIFICPYFIAMNFTAVGLLNGKSLEEIKERLKQDVLPAQLRAWCFWPIIHYITFGPMPYKYRMLWSNSMSTVWNGYLSSVANRITPDLPLIIEPTTPLLIEQPSHPVSPPEISPVPVK